MTDFDLYYAVEGLPAGSLAMGRRVWLDGIDGFFDQYFDGLDPGDLIRFVVYPYRPDAVGIAVAQVAELPFVSARVVEADSLGGTVEVMEVTAFATWLRELPAQATVPAVELREATQAPIEDLVADALRSGAALWTKSAERWGLSRNQVTAVYAHAMGERVRVAVLRTNAVPGAVADIITARR